MPTTPKYALRYPAPTDPADVPTDIGNLATDVETTLGRFTAYGTTLPASPADGQEAILVDSTTNPAYHWQFRYNAGSSSTYKWEFVGGAPIVVTQSYDQQNSTSYVNGNSPAQFTLPRAGDWLIAVTALQKADTSGGTAFTSVAVGATASADTFAVWAPFLPFYTGPGVARGRFNGVSASALVTTQMKVSGAGYNISQARTIEVTPIRVS
jgi:hypothetical protein